MSLRCGTLKCSLCEETVILRLLRLPVKETHIMIKYYIILVAKGLLEKHKTAQLPLCRYTLLG